MLCGFLDKCAGSCLENLKLNGYQLILSITSEIDFNDDMRSNFGIQHYDL